MSEIVIRHIEARDAEALRDIMSHLGCITTRYNFPIPQWICGMTGSRRNREDGISSPVLTSEWLAIWHSM